MGRRSNAQTRERYGVDTDGWDGAPIQQAAQLSVDPAKVVVVLPGSSLATVKLWQDGAAVVGATIVPTSTDVGVATALMTSVTGASGLATIQITGVAVGECLIQLDAPDANPITIAVTVTGP